MVSILLDGAFNHQVVAKNFSGGQPHLAQVPYVGCEGAYRLMLLQVGVSTLHINLFLGRKFSADPIERCRTSFNVFGESRLKSSFEIPAL
jgi:hypothetical protein